MCSSSRGFDGAAVPRTEGTEPRLQFPGEAGYYQQVVTEPASQVWVRLDSLCVRDPGMSRRTNVSGLDMTGERPGLLTHWVPAESGEWLGRVNFSIAYADGRPPLHLTDQLVPGYALRPRRRR